jgi:hypothetical protein
VDFPKEQTDELKRYCSRLSSLTEAGITFLQLESIQLPNGCTPTSCDALLCPATRDGYPSRLFFSARVTSPYTRNWNIVNQRIGEKNWFAFSWKVDLVNPTLVQLLLAHLSGFTKEQ